MTRWPEPRRSPSQTDSPPATSMSPVLPWVSWAPTLDRTFRRVCLVIVILNVCSAMGGFVAAGDVIGPAEGVLAVGQVLLVLGLLQPKTVPWSPLAALVCTAGGGLAVAADPSQNGIWWPSTLMYSLAAVGALLTRGKVFAVFVSATIAVAVVARGVHDVGHGIPPFEAMSSAAVDAGLVVVVVSIATLATRVTGLGRQVDAQWESSLQAERTAALQDEEPARWQEVQRFIHDQVIGFLVLVGLHSATIPAPVIQQEASDLQRKLQGSAPTALPESADLVAALQALPHDPRISVDIASPRELMLPSTVTDAFVEAGAEALRNVARHSGSDRAQVRLRREGMDVTLSISDAGRGFDARSVPVERRGIQLAIRERMESVGGASQVSTSVGAGTDVTLTWRPEAAVSEGSRQVGHGQMGNLIAPFALSVAPLVAVNLWSGPWMAPRLTLPWLALIPSTLMSLVGLAMLRRGLKAPITRGQSFFLIVLAWGASIANAAALPDGTTDAVPYWMAGGAAAACVCLCLYRPLWETVVCGLVLIVIACGGVIHAAGMTSSALSALPAATSACMSLVAAILMRRTLDTAAWQIHHAREAFVGHRRAVAARQGLSLLIAERLAVHRDTVSDLAAKFAEGAVVTEHDARTARGVERLLRQDLLPGITPRLQAEASGMRNDGIEVALRLPEVPTEEVEASLLRAMRTIAAAHDTGGLPSASITMTAFPVGEAWELSTEVRGPREVSGSLASLGWRPLSEGHPETWLLTVTSNKTRTVVPTRPH